MTAIPFDTTALFIAGRWQAAAGCGPLPPPHPSHRPPPVQIARGPAAAVDAPVGAAPAAPQGGWGALTSPPPRRLPLQTSRARLAPPDQHGRPGALDDGDPLW